MQLAKVGHASTKRRFWWCANHSLPSLLFPTNAIDRNLQIDEKPNPPSKRRAKDQKKQKEIVKITPSGTRTHSLEIFCLMCEHIDIEVSRATIAPLEQRWLKFLLF